MKPWKVLSSEYVVENYPYNRTRHDRCVLPSGLEIDTHVLEYPNWVNAVVLTPQLNIVMVNQYRHGIGTVTMETPGGMVDDGEDPLIAITREVAEETGYRSNEDPVFLGKFAPNAATSTNMVSTYLFLNATPTGQQHLDTTEDIQVQLIPFETFGQMIREGKVAPLFTAMGYFLAKDYLATHR